MVQATKTQFLAFRLSEESSKPRRLLDICDIAGLNSRFVSSVSWRIIDCNRVFLDVYVKMAPHGIKRYLYIVDWQLMAVVSSGDVRENGRGGTLPVILPGNRIAVDNEYDAIVVDLSQLREQGKLFASSNSEIDHEELQMLGAVQLDDKRLIFHWGQVGESYFETYCL